MDDHNIIIRPLVTEQGMHFASRLNAYSFEVNKSEIINMYEARALSRLRIIYLVHTLPLIKLQL